MKQSNDFSMKKSNDFLKKLSRTKTKSSLAYNIKTSAIKKCNNLIH